MRGSIDQRHDGLLPFKAIGDMIALQIVAAREAQERWMHRSQLFHQIDAIAVRTIMVCRWKQGDEIEP